MKTKTCPKCGHSAPADHFHYGRGRHYGEHPEHRYCPECGISVDWFGGFKYPVKQQAVSAA